MLVIHVCRKPVAGTVARNALKHGTGGLDIDGTRIPAPGGSPSQERRKGKVPVGDYNGWNVTSRNGYGDPRPGEGDGRWPPNVIFQHLPRCRLAGYAEGQPYKIQRYTDGAKVFGGGKGHPYETVNTGPDLVEVWKCVEGCPAEELGDPARFFKQVQETPEAVRAGGECTCPTCGNLYRQHPYDMKVLDWEGHPFIKVLCDGTRVKL